MSDMVAGFVDVGYLKAEGARTMGKKANEVRLDASRVVEWFRTLTTAHSPLRRLLRTYWYDGAFDPSHRNYESQRRYFDAIAYTPGIQIRLGHLVERPSRIRGAMLNALRETALGVGVEPDRLVEEFNKNWTFYPERHQKGVDTLITLDMIRLASRSAFDVAILIAGDRDLAEAIRTVQDCGVKVIIATPNRMSVANEVLQLADEVRVMDDSDLKSMLASIQDQNSTGQ